MTQIPLYQPYIHVISSDRPPKIPPKWLFKSSFFLWTHELWAPTIWHKRSKMEVLSAEEFYRLGFLVFKYVFLCHNKWKSLTFADSFGRYQSSLRRSRVSRDITKAKNSRKSRICIDVRRRALPTGAVARKTCFGNDFAATGSITRRNLAYISPHSSFYLISSTISQADTHAASLAAWSNSVTDRVDWKALPSIKVKKKKKKKRRQE